ncbi:MAG: YmdB family metallophosphoesterase, partial [Limisphaerales bacterium]
MKLLFIGDIVGSPGRRVVKEVVPRLRQDRGIDVVIANGENSAGGSGITPKTARAIFEGKVDIITSGDHVWDQKEVSDLLANEPRFVRPINYPEGTPGQGATVCQVGNYQLGVINVQCRTFMPPLENPFRAMEKAVAAMREKTTNILVDVHGETTSEKIS